MCTRVFSCQCLLSRIRFYNVAYLRNIRTLNVVSHTEQMRVLGDLSLKGPIYSNSDSDCACVGPHPWRVYRAKRLFSSSVNTDNQLPSTANEKLKALKEKKEAKRMERLTRQRINEQKRNVCIMCVLSLIALWTFADKPVC